MWKIKQVMAFSTFGRTKLYAEIKAKNFPAPIQISAGRVAWDEAAVLAWKEQKIAAAQNAQTK